MASGNTLFVFTAQSKAQGSAPYDTVNGNPVLDFDDTVDEDAIFLGVLPRNYAGGGITATVVWSAAPIAGDVIWDLQFERQQDAVTDMSADSFAAAQSVTETVDGVTEVANYSEIAFTNGGQMDSLSAGESFRVKLNRDANNGLDTMVGDAAFRRLELRET